MLVKAAGLYVFTVGSCLVTEAFRPPAQFLSSSRIQYASFRNSNALSVTTSDAIVSSDVWWKEGLKFGCTACGRCCQNEGEVWLDADEFADLSNNLKESPKAVLEKYSERTMSGWVKLKNQISDDPKINDRCIFLGEDGKQCSIYESRPIQCRTYPFWPRLLSNTEEWNKEGVQPDHVELVEGSADRHWTPATGGCEGFTNPLAVEINPRTIHRNHELYKMYTDLFPFLSTGDDENKLLAKTAVIQGVTKATTAWVEDFVLKYKLCPFAEHVFVTGGIRYRVFLGTDRKKIIERLRYEVLALLTAKEDDVATTLLMLPFACQDFEEFYELSLDLEDLVLPAIERESQGPRQAATLAPKRKSLLQKKMAVKNASMVKEIMGEERTSMGGMGAMSFGGQGGQKDSGSRAGAGAGAAVGAGPVRAQGGCPVAHTATSTTATDSHAATHQSTSTRDPDSLPSAPAPSDMQSSQPFREEVPDALPEIQLAFFHPSFMWADTDFDEPLNYEKRAPFPTINLLRAAKIREFTSEAKYTKIANANVEALEKAGSETLNAAFDKFFKIACEGA